MRRNTFPALALAASLAVLATTAPAQTPPPTASMPTDRKSVV